MRAAIERHAEAGRVGDTVAADVIGRLDHEIAPPGCGETSRRCDSCGASADNDRIEGAAGRRGRGKCRTCDECGRGCKQRTAAQRGHTFHYACGRCLDVVGSPHVRAHIASTAAAGQMFRPDLNEIRGLRRADMFDDATKVITQLFAPPLRAVLWKSIGLALALIVVVGIGLERLIVHLVNLGSASAEATFGGPAHWPVSAIAWLLSIAAGLGIIVGSVMLMPPVTAMV